MRLAFGLRVSQLFRQNVIRLCRHVQIDPSDLMACMAFETGETYSPSITNGAGSGAVGLIQFMPQTASLLGTTTEALAAMTAEGQLDFVEKYFQPFHGRLNNLGDVYLAILWPSGIGMGDDYVMFKKGDAHPARYLQNRGLDLNHDGSVTRGEVLVKIKAKLVEGLLPENCWEGDINELERGNACT